MSDEDIQALAAEYVLGTLDAQAAQAVERAMAADPVLARAVAAWERDLQPLSRLAAPEAPPPGLWAEIEARIVPPSRPVRPVAGWRSWLVPGWAVGATATAAVLGWLIVTGRTAGPETVVAVLLSDRSQPAWTAAFGGDGAVRLVAVPPVAGGPEPATPGDRAQQLWVLPPGATAPTSLGLLPRGQRQVLVPGSAVQPVPGMLVEITLEPLGGSPTGRPTGPVLFIGRLSAEPRTINF